MEFDQTCQANALNLLHRELQQLEADVYQKKRQQKSLYERLERATAQLHLTQQQVDLFRHETQAAKERIRDACGEFTKKVCEELGQIAAPSEELVDLVERYMLLLDQKERSWSAFKALIKLYTPLKAQMDSLSAAHLTEEQLTALLPVWKNQHQLQSALQRTAKGAANIANWISYCVEFKLKMETLNCAQKEIPELEYKIKKCVGAIAEKMREIGALEAQQTRLQAKIDGEVAYSPSSQSANSFRSTAIHIKSRSDDHTAIESSLRFGPQSSSSRKHSDFPNFGSEQLYQETPGERRGEIEYGESSDYCGCKGKLFCL